MATTEHKKAAELRQDAAKSHLAAAECHAKGDAAKGTVHAKVAQQRSQSAVKQTDQVTSKSQQRNQEGPVKTRAFSLTAICEQDDNQKQYNGANSFFWLFSFSLEAHTIEETLSGFA